MRRVRARNFTVVIIVISLVIIQLFAQKSHAQIVGSDLTPVVSQLKHELMIVKHYLDE
jgi:hypothetical protein